MLQVADMPKSRFSLGFFLWLVLFLGTTPSWGLPNTSFTLNHFSSFSKLPGESVQCIYEDHLGILWLGVESLGLVKFDGKNYTTYQNDPDNEQSISSNYPTDIFEDEEGALWVATPNGLNKLDRHTGLFRRYQHQADDRFSPSSNLINDIETDALGRLWLATDNGISIFLPEEDRFYRFLHNEEEQNPAANNEVRDLHLDAGGNIWIATAQKGLYRLKPQVCETHPLAWALSLQKNKANFPEGMDFWRNDDPRALSNSFSFITSNTAADTLWLAGQRGLHYFSVATETFHQFMLRGQQLRYLNVVPFHSLYIDADNHLWAGSADNGLLRINLNDTEQINYLNANQDNAHELKSNVIREIMGSRSGLIWICTKFGGLHYYDKRQNTFPLIKKQQNGDKGLSENFVLSVLEDSRKNIWIGTKSGGLNLCRSEKGDFDSFGLDQGTGGLRSNRIECLAEGPRGLLWSGTGNGVWTTELDGPPQFTRRLNLYVRNFFVEDSAWLWMGTSNGLYRYSLKKMELAPLPTRHKSFFDTESNIGITRVLKDPFGALWIATTANGLFEYHAQNDSLVQHLPRVERPGSLGSLQVRALHIDHQNRFWIGTKSQGLFLFDWETRSFRSMSNPDLLPSNTVYQIIEDDQGHLWLGTHSGISCYIPEENKYISFGLHHGLQSQIFEINAYNRTADGNILMGGSGGLNVFKPNAVHLNPIPTPLIVSKLEVLNKTRAIDIARFKSYTLNHNSNYLSFEFALLDYSNPEENQYAYQLEPFDADWIYSGTRNYANYTNLPPGTYRFRVKGANSDEQWSDQPLELEIILPAPLWKKVWFVPALILLFISLFVLSWLLKIRRTKQRELQLQHEVEARTHDLFVAYNKLEESSRQIERHNKALRRQRDRISRQNLELKIHRQNLELMVADRTRDLEEALSKAEESDRLKSAFLANMSHEIRTPLNAIMGFIDLLEADEFDEHERARINGIIQTNSNALLQLINDIIDISIIEANQLVINKSKIDLHRFLLDLELHYQSNRDLKEKEVELTCQTPQENQALELDTDYGRLWQIYSNLINNAIKFTNKGSISFGYFIQPDAPSSVHCFVKDTGIGIDAANQQKLFQRFHKIEPLNSKVHRGTGLGLSISKHLCELLGGRIWVESELEKGSTFYFTLPLDN